MKEYLINGDEEEGFAKLRSFLDSLRNHIEDFLTEGTKEGNISHFKLTVGFLIAGLRSMDQEVVAKTAAIFQTITRSKSILASTQYSRVLNFESLPPCDDKSTKKTYDHLITVV